MNMKFDPASLLLRIQTLEAELAALKQDNSDLEIALMTAIEHGDAIESQLFEANRQLNREVRDRKVAERRLEQLIAVIVQQKQDLELLVETIAVHGDEIEGEWRQRFQAAEQESLLDALTGLYNRRYFNQALLHTWQLSECQKVPLTIIMADIDYFKLYNDNFGHPQGDQCLASVAKMLKAIFQLINKEITVSRYGGEEFVILLPNTTLDEAKNLTKQMLEQLEAQCLPHPASPYQRVTMSFGLASMIPQASDHPQTLTELADQRLYRAKQQGRNCFFWE